MASSYPIGRPDAGDGDGDERMLPDLSRLRLDALLRELVDRANVVMESEGRVHRLLDAVVSIASDLSLPDVLRRIVQSSCDLVGARFGALGVVGPNRLLIEFVTVGVSPDLQAHIGDLPTGKGILGLLIDHPHSLRLLDLHKHPRSYGFPPNHPPMCTFLGVPIRVRGEIFGNLYLTEKCGGEEFTAEDQEIVSALAAAAGIAIENARLYEQTHRRELWLQASNELTGVLLGSQSPATALGMVARRARTVAEAMLTAIALPRQGTSDLALEVVDGASAEELVGRVVSGGGSAIDEVLASGKPRIIEDASQQAQAWLGELTGELPPEIKELGSAAVVPLAVGAHALGVLVVARHHGHAPFVDHDVQMMRTFCAHAALAIEFARAQEDRQRLAVFEDRDRIARDLHDLVIQRLFAVGLGLQGLTKLIVRPQVAERITGFVDELDLTIREIRRSIFSLQEPSEGPVSLRGELLRAVQEAASMLGYEPRVSLAGPLDSLVPEETRPDLLATLREALSNAARHADARSVSVEVAVDAQGAEVQLVVRDDGRGMPTEPGRQSGLANLADRAERWGGRFAVDSAPGDGTTLTWTAPLRRQP
jgi:signal transduction histidine kinase